MAAESRIKKPKIIFKGDEPTEVILDIEEYRGMLERLEDLEDLRYLNEMRSKPLKFKNFDDLLIELGG